MMLCLIILQLADTLTLKVFTSIIITCFLGLAGSHLMRMVHHRVRIFERPFKYQIFYFLGITMLASILFGALALAFGNANPEPEKKEISFIAKLSFSSLGYAWLFLFWNLGYYFYHLLDKNRKEKVNNLELQSLVKTMELRNIKSQINPHFIFNSLNSIRALVDENPQQARDAITRLSNILRSSLTSGNMETVPLQKELSIVKDYLALEQMRFEERLIVHLDVDNDTLVRPIPPMMLQNLVENAIKHGISKRMEGGYVKIISKMVNGKHELRVKNSGQLLKPEDTTGFGLKSTQDRLKLLYNGKAAFKIYNTSEDEVESCIQIP